MVGPSRNPDAPITLGSKLLESIQAQTTARHRSNEQLRGKLVRELTLVQKGPTGRRVPLIRELVQAVVSFPWLRIAVCDQADIRPCGRGSPTTSCERSPAATLI
jgi:hypothetical protein